MEVIKANNKLKGNHKIQYLSIIHMVYKPSKIIGLLNWKLVNLEK